MVNFTEDFTGFTGVGFAPIPGAGQLDSDLWRITGLSDGDGTFGGTFATGDYARGADIDGGVTTGGTYAFTSGGETFLGVQPGGSDFTPGTITLALSNDTGSVVDALDIAYTILMNNDQARGNTFDFAYSFDDMTYVPVPALDFTSPEAADGLGFQEVARSTMLTGLALAPGADLFLQWRGDDATGGGSRDEFGLDNVMVAPAGPAGPLLEETFDYAENGQPAAFTITDTNGDPESFFYGPSNFDYLGIFDNDTDGGADFGGDATDGFNTYTGGDDNYLVGSDIDGGGLLEPAYLTWSGIDISASSFIELSADLATDDSSGALDPTDFVVFEVSIDGGAFQPVLAFETADDATFNLNSFLLDTDFDGIGDDAALTSAFQTFSNTIPVSGTTLDLRLGVRIDSGFEDIGIDTIAISDASAPAVIVSGTDGVASEDGDTAGFDVVLTTAPTADVTVTLAPDAEGTVAPMTLTFTAANWDVPQSVVVTPVDDADVEGTHAGSVGFAVASADADYNGAAVDDFGYEILDNDFLGATVPEIQGSGNTSPLEGQEITVTAIVTGDFQDGDADGSRNLGGFFIQDPEGDGDDATSDGIFVFDGGGTTDVNIGDEVTIVGTVAEFFGETQVEADTVVVNSSGNAVPDFTDILLPAAGVVPDDSGRPVPDLEAYEGMLVSFPQELTIIEMFQLDRFNEIRLSADGRPQQYTQSNAPDADGNSDYQDFIGRSQIVYDDGLNVQNAAIDNLDGFGPVYDADTTPRMGDTVVDLKGVLNYGWAGNGASPGTYRVRSVEDGANSFEDGDNPRPDAPEDTGGSLTVASFNVLNFFTTIDNGPDTAIGLEPRGADSTAEFDRQLDKLVEAIDAMEADILGLVELENDFLPGAPGNAIERLVDELNTRTGSSYDWVNPGSQFVGTDAISTGIIYDTAAVSLVGTPAFLVFGEASAGTTFAIADVLNPFASPDDRLEDFDRNRPAVAASFEDGNGEVFTVAVNHFKSKGDSNLEDLVQDVVGQIGAGVTQAQVDALVNDPNYDRGDGAGFWNQVRTDAAAELVDWLATDPTGSGDTDAIILGDLNAYAMEDPIAVLQDAGYTDLARTFVGPEAYSFVFDGQTGTLDYAFANPTLSAQVSGATEWHINADEPDAIDYNLDFGRDAAIFRGDDPFRSSDHDPVIVGLDLGTTYVRGTERNDNLRGTAGEDVLISGGGRYDKLRGGDGIDTFDFGDMLGDGIRGYARVQDFETGEILEGVSRSDIDAIVPGGSTLYLVVGPDRDYLALNGVGSLDDVVFADELVG